MTEFRSWQSYGNFARAVITRTRYVHAPEIESFLAAVLETGKKRVKTVPSNTVLWRAQLGHVWRSNLQEAPFPRRRMKPIPSRATDGRANPKGIPYLYLATDYRTALAEVRPWIKSLITLGQFKTTRDLRIANCSDNGNEVIYFKEPSPKKREAAVWIDIDKAFAEPVTRNEDVADYVPTQIIAELFKANGFDGIAYRSSVGPPHKVVLFNLKAADIVSCSLFRAKGNQVQV